MTILSNALVNNYNPAFSKIYQDAVQKVDPVFDQVFDVQTSKQQYEKRGGMTGTGLLSQKTEGQDSVELRAIAKYSKTFTHATYAGHVRITQEAADDDLSGELKKLPMLLGISARQTVEILAAAFWDLSTTTAMPDGVALLSTLHPRVGDAGTWANTPAVAATALSVTSAEAALSAMRQNVDDYGNPSPLFPKSLLIHGANEFMSLQLLTNVDKSGTTNRDINAIRRRGINSIIWDFLTTTTQWYFLTDKSERQQLFYWREKINGLMKAAPDTTDDAIFQSRFRCSLGSIDSRGVYGSIGA